MAPSSHCGGRAPACANSGLAFSVVPRHAREPFPPTDSCRRRSHGSQAATSARRRRRAGRNRRGRRLAILLGVLLVGLSVALAAGAFTAAGLVRTHCDLDVLRPVGIGQNTFVYAADGTSLGSIPAERNRQPVPLVDISPWMRRATIAVEDRRFYRHSGVDYEGIAARSLARPHRGGDRRGRFDADAAARPEPLHLPRAHGHAQAAGGVPRRPAQPRLVEAANPPRVAEHRLLRQPCVRGRGRLADVLLEAARELNLREAAMLAGFPRRLPRTTRSPIRPRRSPRRNIVLQAMLDNGDITRAQYRWAIKAANPAATAR